MTSVKNNPKAEKSVKRQIFRVCVVGPSFVGKSSLVHRIVNNSFYADYFPTTNVQKYRLTYRIKNGIQESTVNEFSSVEIVDTFPHDHPLLQVKAENEVDLEVKAKKL